MCECVEVICVIWCVWLIGEEFCYEGEYYMIIFMFFNFCFELLVDIVLFFIIIVVVGFVMMWVVGGVCDGVWLYLFFMLKYVYEVVLLCLKEVLSDGYVEKWENFEIFGGGFVVIG